MVKLGYFMLGGAIAFVIANLFFRDGKDNLTCNDNEQIVSCCVPKEKAEFPEDPNIDDTMREYYREASDRGDSIGFTIERDLFLSLTAYLNSDVNVKGIRVYPGRHNNADYLLIKPLYNNGHEIENKGKIEKVGKRNFYGPCPKWCGDGSRIIK